MTDTSAFDEHRPLLFSIAYRMLGSASDAEDIVQDAWLRYQGATNIRSPRAFAATVVTRLCLDRLKSARVAREEYVGPWRPEPMLTTQEGPDVTLQRSESVTLAFLVLLEALSPEERAVFLLREVFDSQHREIAEMLGSAEANCRQLFHRAKTRLARDRPSVQDVPAARLAVAARFGDAMKAGDAAAFTELLAQDVGLWADGGGKVSASRRPLVGRTEVLNFLVGLHRVAVTTGGYRQASLDYAEVNGEPAMLVRLSGQLDGLFVMSVVNGQIATIRVVRNPDKLRFIERQLPARLM